MATQDSTPNSGWQPIAVTPPIEVPLETKIEDEKGLRNEQTMVFSHNLWWIGWGGANAMYVYYRPTHWRTPRAEVPRG